MTAESLPPTWVSSAVFQCWSTGLTNLGPTAELPTRFPGVPGDPSGWSEWYELWVDHWAPRPQRRSAPELCDLRITVHSYVRGSLNLARVQQLLEFGRQILDGQTLAIHDVDSDEQILGYIKLGTAQVRELSRVDVDAARQGLQHQVAIWNGLAQRLS